MVIVRNRPLVVGAITLLAALLRLAWLDQAPPGINQDEAMHAWEANCLLHAGKDHSGASWPIFCHAFGKREAHASPFIYLLSPFQAALGMNVWSTRLPGALFGTLAVPLLYFLVRDWYGGRAAILAALLLAISPWHVHLSRLAFEVSICPTLLIGGMLLFSRGLRANGKLSIYLFLASGATFGLLLWTYNAYRVFVPLLLGGGLLIFWPRFIRFVKANKQWKAVIVFAAGFLIGVAPFVWGCIRTPELAWGHAGAEFVGNRAKTLTEAVYLGAKTYLLQISPSFLFTRGDPSITQCVPGHGELYWICAPVLLAGLARIVMRWRSEPIGRFLLLWLIVAPIPAGMTRLYAGHTLRAATALPAYQILSAIGLVGLVEWAGGQSKKLMQGTVALASIGVLFCTVRFLNLFFRVYPVAAAPFFWAEMKPVVHDIMERQAGYDMVLLTSIDCTHGGPLFLFWSGMSAKEYFDSPVNIWEGPDWDVILQVGKYFFVSSDQLPRLIAQLPAEVKRVRVLVAERPGVSVSGQVIRRYQHPHGQEAMVLYDVTVSR